MALSHRKLSMFCKEAAQAVEAGMPLSQAVRNAHGPPARERERLAAALQSGCSLEDALAQGHFWAPAADRALLSAAERSGRLPEAFDKLAEKHEQTHSNQQKTLLASLYPLFVLHLGIFLAPVGALSSFSEDLAFDFDIARYAPMVLVALLPLWAFIALLWMLARMRSPLLRRLTLTLPGLRGWRKSQSLADLAFTLEAFVCAGEPLGRAWSIAGSTTDSPALERAAQNLAKEAESGRPPGERLRQLNCFPGDFASSYTIGEQTGSLDKSLRSLRMNYQQRADRSLSMAAFWYPKLLFLLIAVYAAVNLLGFYAGYLKSLTSIMG